jgi:predicted HicB family RNase H-like nuclease
LTALVASDAVLILKGVKIMTHKQIKEQTARYAKFVEWSDEDKCFIGRCPELMVGGVHGNDEARICAELCAAVEEMIEVIHAGGQEMPHPLGKKEFSGRFVLRVEPAIHRRLAAKALAAGESLNSYCVKTLVKA